MRFSAVLTKWPEGRRVMFCDEEMAGFGARGALASRSVENREYPSPKHSLFSGESVKDGLLIEAAAEEKGATSTPWAIMIGPEGGFSPGERAQLRAMPGAVPVRLGPRILRADTAAVAALTLWQSQLGDWR